MGSIGIRPSRTYSKFNLCPIPTEYYWLNSRTQDFHYCLDYLTLYISPHESTFPFYWIIIPISLNESSFPFSWIINPISLNESSFPFSWIIWFPFAQPFLFSSPLLHFTLPCPYNPIFQVFLKIVLYAKTDRSIGYSLCRKIGCC